MSWDKAVAFLNDSVTKVFGERAVYHYKEGTDQNIDGIFNDVHKIVDPNSGAVVSLNEPTFGIKINQLSRAFIKGDELTVKTVRYKIVDSKIDGQGMTILILKLD